MRNRLYAGLINRQLCSKCTVRINRKEIYFLISLSRSRYERNFIPSVPHHPSGRRNETTRSTIRAIPGLDSNHTFQNSVHELTRILFPSPSIMPEDKLLCARITKFADTLIFRAENQSGIKKRFEASKRRDGLKYGEEGGVRVNRRAILWFAPLRTFKRRL